MKKMTALLVAVCMLMIPMSTSFAMSQKELNNYRNQMADTLNNAPSVTWYDLDSNPSVYETKLVKFKATYIDSGDGYAGFDDGNGNLMMVIAPLAYQFKPGTEYTIAATFKCMRDNADPDKSRLACFIYEQAHLPIMSEYGL